MEKKFSPLRPAYLQSIRPEIPGKPYGFGKFTSSPSAVFYADGPGQTSGHTEIMHLEQELCHLNLLEDAREILKICLRIESIKNLSKKRRS
jgi:hypothetical protein